MTADEDTFRKMRELAEHPTVRDFYQHAESVAGFSLPPSVKALFDKHHRHCFDEPTPDFTKNWGPESANWKWQRLHNEAIFGSAQSATAAVFYHSENLLRMEREVLSFHDRDTLTKLMGRSAFGGGNTQKLDFEYHAFIFAFRRTLDYLSRGIAALVREECKSYNKLPSALRNHATKPWISQILEMHTQHAPHLTTFVHQDRGYSTRDKIAHLLHVPAGSLNVNAQGLFFAGGGESLEPSNRLTEVIGLHLNTLRKILAQCFSSIAAGMPKGA
jgi:hypothetical protein